MLQPCGHSESIGHNKLLSKIAVERLCGNVAVQGRAALYVRWGDQQCPVWDSKVTWTTPTLKHAEELVDRLAATIKLTKLDLFMEGATSATLTNWKYAIITTLMATPSIQDDICALASYQSFSFGAATIAGLSSLYKAEEKVIVSASIWQDTDQRPIVIKTSMYGVGEIEV